VGFTLFFVFIFTSSIGAAELPKIIKLGGQGVTSGSKARRDTGEQGRNEVYGY